MTLIQAYYTEMDRQSTSGKRDVDVLDRLHSLLQRGALPTEGERVTVAAGEYQGQMGEILSVDNPANYSVLLDSGELITAPLDDLQRDWIALAST